MVVLAEQRRSKRYDLGALVSFFWKEEGNHHLGAGFMRDVSIRGVFVVTSTLPPIGTAVRLEICFESSLTDSPLVILAKGQVCRVELDIHNGGNSGFAASTKRFKLQGQNGQLDDNLS